jgi:hypothetical protein
MLQRRGVAGAQSVAISARSAMQRIDEIEGGELATEYYFSPSWSVP